MFDLCIIGAGLIGSSCAKHAAKLGPHLKIALIGPPEPKVGNTKELTKVESLLRLKAFLISRMLDRFMN